MSSSVSNGNHDDSKHELARLCHVVKRDDFDGYGFNLHAEKGKPGQYIGKVDDNSPAEIAGLRQGDRIIEVNSVNIGNETHKQVVQRIKAIACEVQLLVVDPNLASVTSDNHIIGSNDLNGSKVLTNEMNAYDIDVSFNSNQQTRIQDDLPTPPPPPSALSINSSGIITSTDNRDGVNPKTKTENGENLTMKSSQNNTLSTINNTKKVSSNNSGEGLNLKMTAAELRAKLAAKKKYDPKTDTVDLRQKYEIVQKL